MSDLKQFEHLKIPLEAIKAATNNFSEECFIANGGFGKVYKGEIVYSKGKTVSALKRLDRRFGQGDPQFWKEIMMLSQYKHTNIVSLLGYCDDCDEKILVYEYASKTSLDRYLNSSELNWLQRLKICIGVAQGLAYLHDAAGTTQQRILHRDIKSSNIILDDNWNAKIADFGLSKFGPANQKFTFMISQAVGTHGYVDPLYAETGLLTKESDVFSFGVVLFEVLCGRLCFSYKDDKNQPLIGLARQSYEQNRIKEIICDNIKDEIDHYSLQVFAKIAYQCLKRERQERPKISLVLTTLETALQCQEFLQHVVDGHVVDGHEYRTEYDQETEVALHVDSEHEIQAEVVVEEEEQHNDQEEVHEFQQKFEAFKKKVRSSHSLTMENKAFEASGNLSTLHTWNKSFFIFAVLFASAMSFPFRYPSFGFTFAFTNFLYANCRHYMFLFCNGIILLFIFLEYGSKHISKAAYSQENRALGPEVKLIECNLISFFGSGLVEETELTRDRIEDMETELVIHVCSEHENETNVKQIVVDGHESRIEDDHETEVALHVDSEHEIQAEVVVEEEEHDDQEEVHEFQQKCEAFIKKVKQSMHHEGPSYPP